MKIRLWLLFNIFIVQNIHAFLDSSPWLIIDNQTEFDFVCTLKGSIPHLDSNDSQLLMSTSGAKINAITSTAITANYEFPSTSIVLNIHCPTGTTITFNSPLFDPSQANHITIESFQAVHESLQIAIPWDTSNNHQRHFSISHDPINGITATSSYISLYTRWLHTFKQGLKNILLAALQVLEKLPY